MGQISWNIDIDENTKLKIDTDGTVKIIRIEDAGKLNLSYDLPMNLIKEPRSSSDLGKNIY